MFVILKMNVQGSICGWFLASRHYSRAIRTSVYRTAPVYDFTNNQPGWVMVLWQFSHYTVQKHHSILMKQHSVLMTKYLPSIHKLYIRFFNCWCCNPEILYALFPIFWGLGIPYWSIPILQSWESKYQPPPYRASTS